MKKLLSTLFLFLLLLSACSTSPSPTTTVPLPETPLPTPTNSVPQANRPFPQHVTYAPGSILPNHRTQAQLDDDVRAFYDYWKSIYVNEAGSNQNGEPLYRISSGKEIETQGTTVSEGQGYGMLIMATIAGYDIEAQSIFDGLWRFVLAHPSDLDPRLMDWNVPDDLSGNTSAFDGDADIALGLLMADAQWGSGGTINYRAAAESLINAIFESTIGPDSHLPMLGDWVDPNGELFNQYSPRSSDFMLENFRAFGKATHDAIWQQAIERSQEVMTSIQLNYSPHTGLLPDFIVMPGDPRVPEPAPYNFLEAADDDKYSYNAGRVPWRVGLDALLNDNAVSRSITQRISLWAEFHSEGNPLNFHSGYLLSGDAMVNTSYFSTFFVAPLGVAAMSTSSQQIWLNSIYDAVYNTHQDYYQDTINLLCLFVMTGNYWSP